eukprot:TRINITY_DN24895_c0_g1_i2.p3 TRINITY_DN24895_c0_g1~~TRINITY_DN24895_c0_g1_i2.p3  ORF type:complete len:193 (+),score=33.51 TRINITY_DN24895_c0_g1_i2:50-580(+)
MMVRCPCRRRCSQPRGLRLLEERRKRRHSALLQRLALASHGSDAVELELKAADGTSTWTLRASRNASYKDLQTGAAAAADLPCLELEFADQDGRRIAESNEAPPLTQAELSCERPCLQLLRISRRWALCGYDDGALALFDVTLGNLVRSWKGHEAAMCRRRLAFQLSQWIGRLATP